MRFGLFSELPNVNSLVLQPLRETTCLRHRSLEKWVLGHLGSIRHERQVAETAGRLFDLTWPLHGLGREDRRLLRWGAVVHDVGRAIDDETHPEQGARMLIEADELPLDPAERRALAYLTRYHRGKVPACGADLILRRMDDHEGLRILLALLRSADALDSRVIETPSLEFELLDRELRVTCLLDEDTPRARKVYARRKKHRLLEEVLNCSVEVRVVAARALRRVA